MGPKSAILIAFGLPAQYSWALELSYHSFCFSWTVYLGPGAASELLLVYMFSTFGPRICHTNCFWFTCTVHLGPRPGRLQLLLYLDSTFGPWIFHSNFFWFTCTVHLGPRPARLMAWQENSPTIPWAHKTVNSKKIIKPTYFYMFIICIKEWMLKRIYILVLLKCNFTLLFYLQRKPLNRKSTYRLKLWLY